MLTAILVGVVVLLVAYLVAGDFSRTESESESSYGEPAAGHETGPARRPGSMSPSTEGRHSPGGGPAMQGRSRRALKDWPVRSRLLLLVVTSAVAAAVIALCAVRIADVVQGASIHSPVSSVRDRAILLATAAGVVAIVFLVLALWLTLAAARSVLNPVRKLRTGAREVAEVQLPGAMRRVSESNGESVPSAAEPITVDGSEIGEVAHAFNQMRGELLRLAANEASLRGRLNAMFVKLSRRSQSLVERQIRLIENLEQREQDRERLAELYKMGRIASRMHRNSQNLLVVAGQEIPGDWNQPIALVNIMRAAVAEIEDYERVSLNAQPDIAVRGPAVNDVVHLLAELIENATSFSGGGMPVDISGHLMPSGGVVVDITDRGVGMVAQELAYANWRLENPSTGDINVPRWMGLFVVATLAAKHGIKVRLQQAEFGGLTALTWLPDEVLTDQGGAASARLSRVGSAGSRPRSHEATVNPGLATSDQKVAANADQRVAATAEQKVAATAEQRVAATAEQRVIAPRPPEFAPPRDDVRDMPLDRRVIADAGRRPGPLVGRSPQWRSETPPAPSTTADNDAPLAQEKSLAEGGVVIPPAQDSPGTRRLPIFDAVESNWFRTDRGASGSSAATATAANRWSSPADDGWNAAETVDSPSAGAPTSAGLPRRMPNANLVPGAIPGANTETAVPVRSPAAARDRLAGFQRGISEARAAVGEPASPADEDQP
ncbi:MAG: HAMP domain-containing protein [Actinomycetota bacterium]|nr:HAMP domain-containing protein [Actinomycetota bacterium]